MKALASPVAIINLLFLALAVFVPNVKEILTPELEISVITVLNGVLAIVERYRGSK